MGKKRKVVIIGTGLVGSSCAFSFIHQQLCEELVLIDYNHERAVGEALDLLHALPYVQANTHVFAGTYADCHDADIIIIAAGAPPKAGETRLDSLYTSARICDQIVPQVMESGFQGKFLVISNPVDIMAYYVWQLSGLNPEQVIGTGTAIDTARCQHLVGEYLGVNPSSVSATVLGEHGDSQMIAWSQVKIGALPLSDWLKQNNRSMNEEQQQAIQEQTARAGWEVYLRKGTTYYAIAATTVAIAKAILEDARIVLPVSTYIKDLYGTNDVYFGTPALIGSTGIIQAYEVPLSKEEQSQLQRSIQILQDVKQKLK